MTFISHPETPKSTSEFTVERDAPLLYSLFKNIMDNVPVQDQAKYLGTFFTKRHPDQNRKIEVELPLLESMRRQFKHLFKTANDQQEFVTRLENTGFFGIADGVKTQAIDHGCGSNVADATIIGNLEILLKTAQDCNADIILGIYSGDENLFVVAPKNGSHMNRESFQKRFNRTLLRNNTEYYKDKKWDGAKTILKEQFPEEENVIGVKHELVIPSDVVVYTPDMYIKNDGVTTVRQQTPSLRTAFGAIFDSKSPLKDKIYPRKNLSSLFLDFLQHDDSKELNYPEFEQIYPDYLDVQKFSTIFKDIQGYKHEETDPLCMFTIAPTNLKDDNSKSHTLGNHNLIATFNMLYRYLEDGLHINPKENNIKFKQHNGSGIILLPKSVLEIIQPILDNPIELNNIFDLLESQRTDRLGQSKVMRASPFIVATSREIDGQPYQLSKNMTNKEFGKLLDTSKKEQLINETVTLLFASAVANQIPGELINVVEKIMQARGFGTKTNHSTYFINLLKMQSLFSHYHAKRPNNLGILTQYLVDNNLPQISDYLDDFLHRVRQHEP